MRLLYSSYMFFIAFPFLQIIPTGSYNQPYALILGILIIIQRWSSTLALLPRSDYWALVGLAITGIGFFLFQCFPYSNAQELKYLLTYLTPLVMTGAIIVVLKEAPKLAGDVMTFAVVAWVGVAIIQTVVTPTFGSFLIGSHSEVAGAVVESGRGVLSLAPEPTHHGFHMLILGSALLLLGRPAWLAALCVADAILLARSSSAVLALGLGTCLWAAQNPKRLVIASGIGLVGLSIGIGLVTVFLPEESRMIALVTKFAENPSNLLLIDYSVNMRLGGPLAGILHTIDNGLMPNGLSHDDWVREVPFLIGKYDWLLDLSLVGVPSGYGVIFYQLGFLALPLLAIPLWRVCQNKVDGLYQIVVFSSLFVFLGQYYISSPGFSLIYACAIMRTLQMTRQGNVKYAGGNATASVQIRTPVEKIS